jgi:hypothetical protein
MALLVSVAGVRADSPTPWGPAISLGNFDLNSGGGVTMDAAGNFTVSLDFFIGGPAARGLAADGTPVAGFSIQPYGALITLDPIASAALAPDDFMFVWEGSTAGLQARRYSVAGTALDDSIQITAAGGASVAVEPAVAGWAPATDVLFVWATDDPASGDGDGWGIDGRAFTADGTPLGPIVHVNSISDGDQRAPDVAIADAVGILVVWESDGAGGDGDGSGIRAHRYNALGNHQTFLLVNDSATGDQRRPAVAMASNGTSLVVWQGPATGPDPDVGIRGRLVDDQGVPLGPELQINSTVAGDQTLPDVAWFDDDCFQVVWRSSGGIYSQAVALDGTLAGSELQVSTTTVAVPFKRPTVTADGPRSAVSWAEEDANGFDDVFVQRFRPGVFADGFESGDTSAWSVTIP